MRRIALVLLGAVVALTGAATIAVAQQEIFLDGKVRTGDELSIPAEEIVDDDLYLFGGTIDVNGDVGGDLIVFGGQVSIDGTVEGDVLAAAGTVDIGGAVGGDVRVGAGQVTIDGAVGEDLLAGVGRLVVDSRVDGDVLFGGGAVNLRGDVGGDVLGGAGTYERSGTVGGDERVSIEETEERAPRSPALEAVLRFASLFLIGLGLLWVARRVVADRAAAIERAPGPVLGWGLGLVAALGLVPVGLLLIGVVLAIFFAWLGLSLLVALTATLVVAGWVAVIAGGFVIVAVLAPITVGSWLGSAMLSADTPAYLSMAAGVAVLVVVGAVPVLGTIVGLAVTVVGGGTWLRGLFTGDRSASDPATVG